VAVFGDLLSDQRIELCQFRGLAKSRTGLVLVTPSLLKRIGSRGVSDKELSALLASDLLIPVVHGTTYDELGQ
jgi:hypothetical protein